MFGPKTPVRPVCPYCAEHQTPGSMVRTTGGWICTLCYTTLTVKT